MTPTDQAAQVAQAALQAPINNLVILIALVALLIMALGGFLVWKFAPALIGIYKQQAETNSQLTKIVGQNSEQAKLAMASVDSNTGEMRKQTAAIDNQTHVIEGQGHDLRAYQTLVSDNLASHTEQIATNTENIAELTKSVNELTAQIKAMLEDDDECAGVEKLLNEFKSELITIVLQQQKSDKRATTETNVAIVNVIADNLPAELPKENAA